MKAKIKLINVSLKGVHNYRLKDISLKIYNGERVALVGKSGAGKTSLISTANGIISPDNGEVIIEDFAIKSLSTKQKVKIGTLWQDHRLVEELNVNQNINSGALARHGSLWAIKNLISELDVEECLRLMRVVELSEELIFSRVSELSGGQRQRVAIARLLRQRPEIIFADEPFSNLDPKLVELGLRILLNRDNSLDEIITAKTVLISLHRPELISLFDRVIAINKGEIVMDEKVKDIKEKDLESIYIE